MKYYIVNYKERYGEFDLITHRTIKQEEQHVDINELAHAMITVDYDAEDYDDMGDHVSFYGYSYATSVDWIREVTPEEYAVLNKYIG